MPRPCSICQHPERAGIEAALVAGKPHRAIGAAWCASRDAVTRHGAHLLVPLKQAQAVQSATAESVAQALDVVQQLQVINAASLTVLREARQVGDGELALKAIDRVQRQIELQAKLLGELDERPQVNLLVAPEWLTVRAALLAALAPYPEARTAVATRLLALEGVA